MSRAASCFRFKVPSACSRSASGRVAHAGAARHAEILARSGGSTLITSAPRYASCDVQLRARVDLTQIDHANPGEEGADRSPDLPDDRGTVQAALAEPFEDEVVLSV